MSTLTTFVASFIDAPVEASINASIAVLMVADAVDVDVAGGFRSTGLKVVVAAGGCATRLHLKLQLTVGFKATVILSRLS